jgi:hypothetical protein
VAGERERELAKPVRVTVAPAATVRVPVLVPAAAGVNLTTTVQLEEAAKEESVMQLFVVVSNSPEGATDQPPRLNAEEEVLVRVRVRLLLLPTGVLGKTAGLGVKVKTPVNPVPVSEAVASATLRVAVLTPIVVGLKTIRM